MKIIQVHNKYRIRGGECVYVDTVSDILSRRGMDISFLTRNSKEIGNSYLKKIRALTLGIYSRSSERDMASMIHKERPDIVHVHNLYPLLSPSVLVACRKAGVAVVMHCHNYRLICPIGIHLHKGTICERCCNGREYWCILKNCRNDIFESAGYAIRNIIARQRRLFMDNITCYISPVEFVKRRLVEAGFSQEHILILPNLSVIPESGANNSNGKYVLFVGRISPEKDVNTLLISMQQTKLPIRIAGDYSAMPEIVKKAPSNVKFLNMLNSKRIGELYHNARFLVIPSKSYEVSSIVAAEAMAHALPIIASRIGGLPEVVEDGITGLLFEPGNSKELADKIKFLWENPKLSQQMGQAGRAKAIREFSEDVYYKRLMVIYRKAIEMNKGKRA